MASNRMEILRTMVAQNPADSFARYGLAMEHMKAGDFEQAVEQFRELLAVNANYAAAYFHGGQALEKLGRIDEARATRRAQSTGRASRSPGRLATHTPTVNCRARSICCGDKTSGAAASAAFNRISVPLGAGPGSIAIADVNHDGHPDLPVANMTGQMLGDGCGGFSPSPRAPFPATLRPHVHGVAVADFNSGGARRCHR
jgi:hypothetical protein